MRKLIILLAVFTVLLTGCANHVNVEECLPIEEPSGFWSGTWDGMIMFPSFIGSLIWDDIAVYAVNNNGPWYDFGFIGGFGIILKLIGMWFKNISSTSKIKS